MEPNKKTALFLFLALFWSIAIIIACLASLSEMPPVVAMEQADKIAHFGFYTIFSSLWFLYFRNRIKNTRNLFIIVFLFSFLFGIGIEICQAVFTENRHADVEDALANTLGAIFGLSIMAIFFRSKKNKFS